MNKTGHLQTVSQQRPLHIGLNAHLLSLARTYRSAGINGYIYNLLIHLARSDDGNRYTVYLGEKRFPAAPPLDVRLSRLPTVKPLVRILWEQIAQPLALRRDRIDLLHALAFVAPYFSPCPSVITVYDLSFLRLPEGFKRLNRLYLSHLTRRSARRARRIIAISESTKRDIVRLLRVSEDKVDVVYCGVDERFRLLDEAQVAEFRRRRGLPERMILFLGTLEPRKNVGRLIEAYARLEREGVGLVIAGARGWRYDEIFSQVEAMGLSNRVLFPGYVPEEEKALWYNAAEVFVFPSLYEGFGLPPLEAMTCGTPVITSNVSSLPEVVGEAGLTVDPRDVEALATAMRRVLRDAGLRRMMSEQGQQQAKRFSWSRTARETVAVYGRAMTGGGN